MREDQDAMMLVRAELCDRLESLQLLGRNTGREDFGTAVARIRELAAAYGLTPVVRVAQALERAAWERDSCPTALYLDRLRDAIGCRRMDDAASEAMIASISVRLGA